MITLAAAVELEWGAISVILTVLCTAVGAGTVYLRMFVRSEFLEMEKVIRTWASRSFETNHVAKIRREASEKEIEELKEHVTRIYARMDRHA